mgnify:FL=1
MPRKEDSLKVKNIGPLFNYGLIVILFIVLIPLINYSVMLNELLDLPEFLHSIETWMKNAEESAKKITTAFLSMNSISELLLNIVLIAVLPALGEELIFRGILQQLINKDLKTYHIGIWVSAIIFSAIHFQFYGFFPRMFLGAFFGYLFYWSGNLWLAIFAHCLNNATGVIAAYYLGSNSHESEFDQLGTKDGSEIFTLISAVLFILDLMQFKNEQKKSRL